MDKKQIEQFLHSKVQDGFIESFVYIEDDKYKVIKKFQNVSMEFDVRVKENPSQTGEQYVIIFNSVFDKEEKKIKNEIDEIYKHMNFLFDSYKKEINELKLLSYSLFLHIIGSRTLSENDIDSFSNKIFNEIE